MSVRAARYDFEILVKSFLRFRKLLALVESARALYPGVTIRVADDSPESAERHALRQRLAEIGCVFYPLPENVGIPAGRNLLVRQVQTPYFLLTDDDKVFTRRTRVEQLQQVLEADPGCVLAAGMSLEYGWVRTHRHGRVEVEGGTMRWYVYGDRAPTTTVGGVTCVPCRMASNFFLARTSLFHDRGIQWDERLKLNEHLWFFHQVPPDLRIYTVPSVTANHFPTLWGEERYRRHRFDPAETTRLLQLENLRRETVRVYDSRRRRVLGRIGRWMWRRVGRRKAAPTPH